ncbi:hypothetical protein M3I01_013370 [Marinomonas sp. RSW2]|uniref:Uncharacterized protein n=1 Tax=Marinomonas maritima TaxID=2940935 RepID=A0ABT5WGU2_9GAMM|nr:hypothetical protein [Marinomonas maritima]MDE8603887.1 hypothetical protein [Marinomonas maritima]
MKKAWLYCLDQSFEFSHERLNGIEFQSEWVKIANSKMTIKSGYAWDGCSPKIHVFGLFVVGTPNGCLRHGKSWTYYDSLVHDVLCQFRDDLKLSKDDSVIIFNDSLKKSGWPLRKLYINMVRWFGPQDWHA